MVAKGDIGRLFMFGFNGTEPTKTIIDFIKNDGLGGVILFRRNIKSAEQLRELTDRLQDAAGGRLLIGIDQEGGRVSNLPPSIIDVPPMEELGRDYVNGESTHRAHRLGHEFGNKLKLMGINLDFAPVLDVLTNDKNPIIGNRAFSSDPEIVALLGCEVARGMAQSGLIACGKHFPGHGDTAEDSHVALPRLRHNRERLDEIELVPFRMAIEKGIPALMSAHVVYETIDPKNPATLSKKILIDILRKELAFKGVLFSDDLEMRAITDYNDISSAAIRSIDAGCDMILICHTESYQKSALDAVRNGVDSGKIPSQRIHEALRRIKNLAV